MALDPNVAHVRADKQGRIVIPAEFREKLGIEPGETLTIRLSDGELRLETLRQTVARIQADVRQVIGDERSLVDELIAERRLEAERE